MSNSYFEQSPISDIQISELKLPLSGLIVLVGANSSGKTNLLRELHAAISGAERPLIVAKEIRFRPAPGFNDYLVHLQQTGDMESVPIPGGAPQYRKIGHQFGTQIGTGGQWPEHELKGWYGQFENYTAQPLSTRLLGHHFLAQIGLMQCSALFIEQRISLTAAAGLFDTHLRRLPLPYNH
jgi:energy-coupling factor transporter ATP-binding protein EcfA2